MARINEDTRFEYILELLDHKSFISDFNNADEIKNRLVHHIFEIVFDELASKMNYEDITYNDFQIQAYETLKNYKQDLTKIFSIYQEHIKSLKFEHIEQTLNKVSEISQIHKKTLEYKNDLLNKERRTYNVNEVMKILGYTHKASVYNHINNNNLKVNKISTRKTIIFEHDLDLFLQKTYKIKLEDYLKLSQLQKKMLHKN